jgi:hypothetical protein
MFVNAFFESAQKITHFALKSGSLVIIIIIIVVCNGQTEYYNAFLSYFSSLEYSRLILKLKLQDALNYNEVNRVGML